MTRASTGDPQTRFCLSLCGGSCCAQGLFELSEHLWWEWGFILNMNSPLLPSCWGFSFALGHRVSLYGHSSAVQLQLYILIIIYCNRAGLAVLCCKQVPGSPLSFIIQCVWLPFSRFFGFHSQDSFHVSNDYWISSCCFCIPVRSRYICVTEHVHVC